MPIPRVGGSFQQDKPLTSSDFNQLVDGSVDIAEAWPLEHDAEGKHAPARFEKGIALFRSSGGSWYVERYDGPFNADVQTIGSDWHLIIELVEPHVDDFTWGILAVPFSPFGEAQLIAESLDFKTTQRAVVVLPASMSITATDVLVHVVGLLR